MEQLAQGEQPDHDGDQRHADQQVHRPEREAWDWDEMVDPDGREHQAEDRGRHTLGQRVQRDRRDRGQREHDEREHLRRLERERDSSQLGREQDEDHAADDPSDEGREGRERDSRSGSSLLRHRVSVEHGHGARWGSRDSDRDRRDGAAVNATREDARHHHDRLLGRELERQREEKRDRQSRGEPGDGTHEDPEQNPTDEVRQQARVQEQVRHPRLPEGPGWQSNAERQTKEREERQRHTDRNDHEHTAVMREEPGDRQRIREGGEGEADGLEERRVCHGREYREPRAGAECRLGGLTRRLLHAAQENPERHRSEKHRQRQRQKAGPRLALAARDA